MPKAVTMFSEGLNPHYFVNPPALTYVLHFVFDALVRGCRRRAQRICAPPWRSLPGGAGDRCSAGHRGGMDAVSARSAPVRSSRRPARGCDRGGRVPAGVLWAPGPQRRRHTAAADAVALRQRGCDAVWAKARLCARRNRPRAGLRKQVHGRHRDSAAHGCCRRALSGLDRCDARPSGSWPCRPAAVWPPGTPGCVASRAGGVALGRVCALASFLLANPYALLDFKLFYSELVHQSSLSDEAQGKLGAPKEIGILYYLWSFSWGLGWVPAMAALGGAIAIWRRHARVGWLLVPAAILFLAFMGLQDRYFGRWLLPIFPIACVLAAYFASRAWSRAVASPRKAMLPRAREGAVPRSASSPPFAALRVLAPLGRSIAFVLLAQGARLQRPQRPRALACGYAQHHARMDGRRTYRAAQRSWSSRSCSTRGSKKARALALGALAEVPVAAIGDRPGWELGSAGEPHKWPSKTTRPRSARP